MMANAVAATGQVPALNVRFPFAEESCRNVTRSDTERLEWPNKCDRPNLLRFTGFIAFNFKAATLLH
jgi:hypothetical protein